MSTHNQKAKRLIGIGLTSKTTNENNQSMQDIGGLWARFEVEKCRDAIAGKTDQKVYAVYHDYDGDHTKPFAYFIGCEVNDDAETPGGMICVEIPIQDYHLHLAKGKMPDCIGMAWREIWESDINRAYTFDFEVYGEKSYDWNNAEVEIFLSVK